LKNCRWRAFQWVDEFTREKPVVGRMGKLSFERVNEETQRRVGKWWGYFA